MRQLIINKKTDDERIALLENGRLAEVWIKEKNTIVGNIYKGKVTKVLPGMEAVFVDLGQGRNGYLHRNDIMSYFETSRTNEALKNKNVRHFISQGEEVIVQVVKESGEFKGPKVTMNIELRSPFFVYQPFGHTVAISKKIISQEERKRLQLLGETLCSNKGGIVFRTAAERADDQTIKKWFDDMLSSFEQQLKSKKVPSLLFGSESFVEQIIAEISPHVLDEIVIDDISTVKELKKNYGDLFPFSIDFYSENENIFSYYAIEHEIERALKKIVWLKNGAFIVIEETEAMIVIDVNTGKFSGKNTYRDTVLKTNEEAAKEIARQLRLRNLSGIILIDFIDMEKEDRSRILRLFQKELEKDRIFTKVIGFTELNILQLTRKKTRKSLSELLLEPCPACGGTGRKRTVESIAFELERTLLEHAGSDDEAVLVEAAPEVCDFFTCEYEKHLKKLEELIGMKIFFSPSDHVKGFEIRQWGTEEEVALRISKMY